MIKKTITYNNYDEEPVSATLHFHVKKSELLENLDLAEKFEHLQFVMEGPKRDLTKNEVMDILKLVKRLIRLAYGERSEDGVHFRKSDAIWQDFQDSNAYDTVLFELFENPEEAVDFMAGIMPKDLRDQALAKQAEETRPKAPQDRLPKQVAEAPSHEEVPFTSDVEVVAAPGESIEELEARLKAAREAQTEV